jgi:hypothetical protein
MLTEETIPPTECPQGKQAARTSSHIEFKVRGTTMTDDQQITAPMPDVTLSLQLQRAVETWYEARHRYQVVPMTQQHDAYNKATDELGQAFSQWKVEQPELIEQLRLWFATHPED